VMANASEADDDPPRKPKPLLLTDAAEFIPTTLASELNSGPPESPGWIGASVWTPR
jgi:hypothetical protein